MFEIDILNCLYEKIKAQKCTIQKYLMKLTKSKIL